MCFDNDDYDWYPSIIEDQVFPVTEPVKCSECRRFIRPGGWRRHIFLQQHEYCRHDPDSDDYDGNLELGPSDSSPGCPEGCEHDFGETFDYDRCKACDQLIEAIHQHELAEGCGEYESRPALEELDEAMDRHRGPGYLAKAEELYSGITARLPESFTTFRGDDN